VLSDMRAVDAPGVTWRERCERGEMSCARMCAGVRVRVCVCVRARERMWVQL